MRGNPFSSQQLTHTKHLRISLIVNKSTTGYQQVNIGLAKWEDERLVTSHNEYRGNHRNR